MKWCKLKIRVIVLLAIILYGTQTAHAWGMIGHRVVGQIADSYLTPKAKLEVKKILGSESMAMVSNWADFVRSDSTYKYLDSWHYVNLSPDLDKKGLFNFLATNTDYNIYNRILAQTATLKNKKSTMQQKQFALRLLIHFLGDLYQPLHVGRKADLGGNAISVLWFDRKSNLHRVWDEDIILYQKLSYTEYANAINHPTTAQLQAWRTSPLQNDIYESYLICNRIYKSVKADDKLGFRYNYDFIEILNTQLLKGGVRLAQILNDIYTA